MSWKHVMIMAVAIVGLSVLAMACSDDDDTESAQEGVEEANTQLCADLAKLETSLDARQEDARCFSF